MKTAIVTDSTANLSQEEKNKYFVELVPVNVLSEGKVYRDGIDLTPAQAYELLDKNPDDWATSAPSPGDFLTAYKKVIAQGAKEIICLAPPPKLSATWNGGRLAKEALQKEMPDIKIEVIDSGTAAAGEKLIIQRLGKAAEQDKTFEELVQMAESLKEKIRLFIALDTIRYIYRSGRIPEIASKIGGILPLKPIITIHQGKIGFSGAAMSRHKNMEKILGILKENFDQEFPEIILTHINERSGTEDLKNKILESIPSADVSITEFSPIFGYAFGRGVIGASFFSK